MEDRLTPLRDSHFIRCFLFRLNYGLFHCEIVAAGEVHQVALFRKVEATLERYATGLPLPGHLGH